MAAGIAVAGHIQPVPAPPLAVFGTLQKPFDQQFVGILSVVSHKRFHLFVAGGQADQIKIGPADQRAAVGLGRRRETFLQKTTQHKLIDGSAGPRRSRMLGNFGKLDWLIGPMISVNRLHPRKRRIGIRLFFSAPHHSIVNPVGEMGLFLFAEHVAFGRHHQIFLFVAHHPVEQTRLSIAGHNGFAPLAALKQGLAGVNPQSVFLCIFAMAACTLFDKQRTDIVFEVIEFGPIVGYSGRHRTQKKRPA